MVGEVLADRYQVTEKLEQGQRLSTYLAVDMALKLEVEVDVLEAALSDFPIPASRVEEILDVAMHVRDPHAFSLHGWGDDLELNIVYLVRERLQGTPLREILAESSDLPGEQVEEVVEAVTEVLAEAYGKRLFYLGLNPGQIMIGARGEIKLARVGFGWLLEEMEPVLAARVSPYRAPETDGGGEGSRTSDIYSLAVMVREMLPRNAGSSRLEALLERCLDPMPKRRPSSSRLLLEELQGVRDEPGKDGPAPGGGARPPSPEGRAGGLRFLKKGAKPNSGISPPRRSGASRLRMLLLMLAGGLIIWLLFAAISGGLAKKEVREEHATTAESVEKVTMPNLEGLTAREAEEILEDLGLGSTTREAPSRLWSAGRVAAQEPQEGTVLARGDTVCLVVSSGSDDSLEPDGGASPEAPPPTPPAPVQNQTSQPSTGSGSPGGEGASGPAVGESASAPAAPLPPRAVAVLSTRSGSAPLYLAMDASGSYDPDGSISRYVWSCGDGTVLEGVTAQHVFDPAVIPARFQVVLQVFDGDGMSSSAAITVEVY